MGHAEAPLLVNAVPAKDGPADLMLVVCSQPGRTAAQSNVMLARMHPAGLFELLTAGAWARSLGYPLEELRGRWLCELMVPGKSATAAVVAALLDTSAAEPLDVTLRCKDERRKCFRFHRRFDPRGDSIFVLADELS